MRRYIKLIITFLIVIFIIVWYFGRVFYIPALSSLATDSAFFWLELLLILNLTWIFKPRGIHLLYFAFLFTSVGGFFNIVGMNNTSEFVLRASLVVWGIGLLFYLIESARGKKNI